MHAMQTGRNGHYCPECSRWFPGDVVRRESLCCDHMAGTDITDVCTNVEYGCQDPAGSCWLDEDDYEYVDDLWQCGRCNYYYGEVGDAITCCT